MKGWGGGEKCRYMVLLKMTFFCCPKYELLKSICCVKSMFFLRLHILLNVQLQLKR